MEFLSIFIISLGLAMDACAVSLFFGLKQTNTSFFSSLKDNLKMAFFFGFFQFAMPIVGWLIGINIANYIKNFDHWIAFLILTGLGAKIVYDGIKNENEKNLEPKNKIKIIDLILLAIATSIDALTVGLTFAFLKINIYSASSIIGITTFISCLIAFILGFFLKKISKNIFRKAAEIAGGTILIIIGSKILIQHLFF